MEEAVLGALLIDRDAILEINGVIRPEDFSTLPHQEIFRAICNLYEAGHPIDILTVINELKSRELLKMVGGASYISELTNAVSSSANIAYHRIVVLEYSIRRQLLKAGAEFIEGAADDTKDIFDSLMAAQERLMSISDMTNIGERDKPAMLQEYKDRLNAIVSQGSETTGVPSGLYDLDKLTHGFQGGEVTIIAARPGMGKTAFVLSIADNMARRFDKSVLFFSLEMSSTQLLNRLVSRMTNIPHDKIRKGLLTAIEVVQIESALEEVRASGLEFDDRASMSMMQIKSKCLKVKQRQGLDCVIVDYMQLMEASHRKGQNREQEISSISRGLKMLSKEMNAPVLALSQLSRDVEKRGGIKKPQLSDLRESGSIEQDADVVIFLYRDEYYHKEGEVQEGESVADAIIAKNRNGALDSVHLEFNPALVSWGDARF